MRVLTKFKETDKFISSTIELKIRRILQSLIQRWFQMRESLQVTDKWTEKNWKPEFSILWKENMMFGFPTIVESGVDVRMTNTFH